MRKVFFLVFVLLYGLGGDLLAQGIEFRSTYEEARAEAVKQKKLLFIDFYTEWCGPCKGLKKNVFPDATVGDYFNRHFVSVELDAEKAGREFAKRYDVSAYPTLLFLNAEGEVVNKVVGAVDAATLLKAGQDAVALEKDPNNIANLQKQYEARKSDPDFLELYIKRMSKAGELSYRMIDDYLKVQQKMRERGSKMMEYLLKYRHYLLLGGEAERIFDTNEDYYLKMSTRAEEKKLLEMRLNTVLQTRAYALEKRDAGMYEVFLDRWVKLKEKPYYQDYTGLKLELLLLKEEMKEYRKQAYVYLDSIVDSRPVGDIIAKDQARYEKYCEENPGGGSYREAMRDGYKGLDAKLQIVAIVEVGNQLLKNVRKPDYKRFAKWIAHGKALAPDGYVIPNFEANVLWHQGKKKEATEAKRTALSRMPQGYRFRQNIEKELKEMENDTFNQGIVMER